MGFMDPNYSKLHIFEFDEGLDAIISGAAQPREMTPEVRFSKGNPMNDSSQFYNCLIRTCHQKSDGNNWPMRGSFIAQAHTNPLLPAKNVKDEPRCCQSSFQGRNPTAVLQWVGVSARALSMAGRTRF